MQKELLAGEAVKRGRVDTRYLLKPGVTDTLMIGFAGFSPPGKPPVYNYVHSLKDSPHHRLYVLDEHGPEERQCSYYLGEPPHDVRADVEDLIREQIEEIGPRQTIAFGSSKGGWAALYFAARLGLDAVIAAEPQVLLGRYLNQTAPAVARFIGRDDLDALLLNTYRNTHTMPKITLYLAEQGSYRQVHIPPLLEVVEARCVYGPFRHHGEVGEYFPTFLAASTDLNFNGIIG